MRLVVIGGVAAGMSAAARARRLDKSLDIEVLEKGSAVAYGACGLPYYLSGRVKSLDELIVYTPEYFRRERNIWVRTGAEAVAVCHSQRQVVLAGGERLRYDRLVIATGARLSRSFEGAGSPRVFSLQTLEDAQRLREFVETRRPRRAAVIGAGYIGLEVADALRARGLAVTVFEAEPYLLGRPDRELSRRLCARLEESGIEVRLETRVTTVEPEALGCDFAVLAAGVRPNVELAAEAGVQLGRTGAIHVNERMETNLSGVFAAGDCCETVSLITGAPVYLPLGTTANKMGRVAGANAAGGRERFAGIVGTLIVQVCGLGVGVTGLSQAEARKEGFDPVNAWIEAEDKPRYFEGKPISVELVADRRTRRLLGGTVVGEEGVVGRLNVLAAALAAGIRVDQFQELDLAYAPPFAPVWDPVLIAAQQLVKLLD